MKVIPNAVSVDQNCVHFQNHAVLYHRIKSIDSRLQTLAKYILCPCLHFPSIRKNSFMGKRSMSLIDS